MYLEHLSLDKIFQDAVDPCPGWLLILLSMFSLVHIQSEKVRRDVPVRVMLFCSRSGARG